MRIKKRMKCAHLAILILVSALTAAAQGFSVPSGRTTNFIDWNESFEGTTGASGTETQLTSSAAYHFGRFSVGAGIPIYFDRAIFPSQATFSHGIGDAFVTVGATGNDFLFNYSATLTAAAPTGNPDYGFGTGHATFDLNDHIDHDFGFAAPFIDAGVANTTSDTEFFHRPFASYGYLAHLEGGAEVDLPGSFKLLLSAYEIAPWGTQTIVSRDVVFGATGSGGQDGRVWEVNHLTTGPAYINHDAGFTAGLTFHPKPYLNLSAGYTRSVSFAFNTISWKLGINMSRLISGGKLTR
jgi:hypothetical protein